MRENVNQEDNTLKCGVPVNLLSVEESRWDSAIDRILEVITHVLNHRALSAKGSPLTQTSSISQSNSCKLHDKPPSLDVLFIK